MSDHRTECLSFKIFLDNQMKEHKYYEDEAEWCWWNEEGDEWVKYNYCPCCGAKL